MLLLVWAARSCVCLTSQAGKAAHHILQQASPGLLVEAFLLRAKLKASKDPGLERAPQHICCIQWHNKSDQILGMEEGVESAF